MMNAYEKALKLLKIRPHHSAELTKKLLMRGFGKSDIEGVIKKLQDQNLVDNDQFAQMYLDELLRNKVLGYFGFKAKLMQRGIPSDEADSLLKRTVSLERERMNAAKIAEKEEDKRKLVYKLQSRGFRSEIINDFI